MGTKNKHEVVLFENGSASLASPEHGEAMHSSIGPWEEALTIYVGQSDLAKRAGRGDGKPIVIYDLGLGIAANAIAALRDQKVRLTVWLVSFENDLGGLKTALANPARFPFLAPHLDLLRELLERRIVERENFRWELREGDFLEQDLSADAPELVYFDFYSPKSGSALWSIDVFRKLREAMEKRRAFKPLLLTYSAATPVRAGLLLAGFFVGKGVSTTAKSETTIAALEMDALSSPLDCEWLKKLERSDRFAPFGMEGHSRAEIISRIRSLPQFMGASVYPSGG